MCTTEEETYAEDCIPGLYPVNTTFRLGARISFNGFNSCVELFARFLAFPMSSAEIARLRVVFVRFAVVKTAELVATEDEGLFVGL